MIFDTHAHYDDEAFDQDRDELLNSMNENGIINIVNVGADIRSSGNSIALAERYDYIYAAVGVHPSDTAGITDADGSNTSWGVAQYMKYGFVNYAIQISIALLVMAIIL